MPSLTKPASLFLLLLSPAALFADDKLDQVLEELAALRQQVDSLEQRLEAIESEPAAAAPAATAEKGERRNFFDAMRIELKKAEVRASGEWTKPQTWQSLEKGMDEEEVIALLGEPTDRKFSVRKDTDEIFHYRGDLDGTGELIEGEVRIYKGKVRRFVVPDFASE